MGKVEKQVMGGNIWKYYLFSFFRQFFFFIPVLVLFFQENNLSMTEILLLQSLYAIAIMLLEVPTGTIGDYFGKKTSISLGALLFAVGLGIYSIGADFYVFLVGELVCGFGSSLISGSDSALLHSTLRSLKREKEYRKIEGTALSLNLTGFMIAGLIGGWIAHYSLRMTMLGSAGIAFAPFLISLFLVEPRLKIKEKTKETFREIMVGSIRIVKNHKLILWLFFYSSLLLALAHVMIWYYQPYFVLVNIPVIHFGWIYAMMGVVSIIAARYTHQIEEFFGNKGSLVFLSALIVVPSFLLGKIVALFAVCFFFLHQIFTGIAKTIFKDRILKVIPHTKAATILSINNLGDKFFYAVTGPIFGYITDIYDLQTTFLALSVVIFVSTAVLFFVYRFIPEHFHEARE